MSEAELIFAALLLWATGNSPPARSPKPSPPGGMPTNQKAAQTGGSIARRSCAELETRTGRKVVSAENYLPPPAPTKHLKP